MRSSGRDPGEPSDLNGDEPYRRAHRQPEHLLRPRIPSRVMDSLLRERANAHRWHGSASARPPSSCGVSRYSVGTTTRNVASMSRIQTSWRTLCDQADQEAADRVSSILLWLVVRPSRCMPRVFKAYFLNVDTSTTHQITTAPTMKQADEVMSPFRTAITRARGPLFRFLTEGSMQNTTGNRLLRQKLAATKKGIENFLTGSLLEVRPMSINKLQGLRPKVFHGGRMAFR
jgi:hypothetical protein